MSENLIFNWLEKNNKDGVIPVESFEEFLKSRNRDYDQTVQCYTRLGVLSQPGDGFLHYRGRPTTLPRIEVMWGETRRLGEYEFVKRGATISRDFFLDENPIQAMRGLQDNLRAFQRAAPIDLEIVKLEADSPEKVFECSTIEIKSKNGMPLATMQTASERIVIVPSITVKADLLVFKNFLIPKVLEPIKEKCCGTYALEVDDEGYVREISFRGKLNETQFRDLSGAVRWTLERASEKTREP